MIVYDCVWFCNIHIVCYKSSVATPSCVFVLSTFSLFFGLWPRSSLGVSKQFSGHTEEHKAKIMLPSNLICHEAGCCCCFFFSSFYFCFWPPASSSIYKDSRQLFIGLDFFVFLFQITFFKKKKQQRENKGFELVPVKLKYKNPLSPCKKSKNPNHPASRKSHTHIHLLSPTPHIKAASKRLVRHPYHDIVNTHTSTSSHI